ncbi:hypothetical protein [Methylobacterium sp. Leaf91]|uniref:hypothetical protein n=1 Tax=Methylobacterium sp. Leaf91 TaxID=1736247 RepID=UPI000A5F86E4|nr:hypothetical protein [Methylobacterium sp. Leaf91]
MALNEFMTKNLRYLLTTVCALGFAGPHCAAEAQFFGPDIFRSAIGAEVSKIKEEHPYPYQNEQSSPAPFSELGRRALPATKVNELQPKVSAVYMVAGLGLGERLSFDSAVYRQYECYPSHQFRNITWCKRSSVEQSDRGDYALSTSILHDAEGRIVYIERSFMPAYFGPTDIDAEIKRLSRLYVDMADVKRINGGGVGETIVLARWGGLKLLPLDDDARVELQSGLKGQSIVMGFHADRKLSFKYNTPLFRLAGGPGFVWNASRDNTGRGHLRFLAVDPSKLDPIEQKRSPNVAPDQAIGQTQPTKDTVQSNAGVVPPATTVKEENKVLPSATAGTSSSSTDNTEAALQPIQISKVCPARSVEFPQRYNLVKASIEAAQQKTERWKEVWKSAEEAQKVSTEKFCDTKRLDAIRYEIDKMPMIGKKTEEDSHIEKLSSCLDEQISKVEKEIEKLQRQPEPVGSLLRIHGELIQVKIRTGLLARGYRETQGTLKSIKMSLQAGIKQCNI